MRKTKDDMTLQGLSNTEFSENDGTGNADNADNMTDAPKTDDTKGVFVYIGPSIRGVITNGRVFKGTKTQILERLSGGIEKYPLIAKFIFRDKDVAAAREKLSDKKGSVHVAYNRLLDMINDAGTHKEG